MGNHLTNPQNKNIIVALDEIDEAGVLALADKLDPSLCRLKIGKSLFTRYGRTLVEKLIAKNYEIFLDLKFHDIPHQVALACEAASDLGVWMLTVHASGGLTMLQAAREAVANKPRRPLVVAVTILTSLNESDIHAIGFSGTVIEQVNRLTQLVSTAQLDGIVCSPQELATFRAKYPPPFCFVTPGIRLSSSVTGDDQKRTLTPKEALAAGSDYLVIGRPITQAADPKKALIEILKEK